MTTTTNYTYRNHNVRSLFCLIWLREWQHEIEFFPSGVCRRLLGCTQIRCTARWETFQHRPTSSENDCYLLTLEHLDHQCMSSAWLNQRHSINIYTYTCTYIRYRGWNRCDMPTRGSGDGLSLCITTTWPFCLLIWLYLSWIKRVFNQGATRQSSQFCVRTIRRHLPRDPLHHRWVATRQQTMAC